MKPDTSLLAHLTDAMAYRDLRNALEALLLARQTHFPAVEYGMILQSGRPGFLHVFGYSASRRRLIEQELIRTLLDGPETDSGNLASLALSTNAQPTTHTGLEFKRLPIRLGDTPMGWLLYPAEPAGNETAWAEAIGLLALHFHRLRAAASHDHLTKLANRASFDNELHRTLELHQRHNLPFTVGLLDVNGFKQINDHQGHQAGDRVLQNIGNVLAKEIRSVDIAARYGGDEFAVMLSHTYFQEAQTAISRIQASLQANFANGPRVGGGWVHVSPDALTPEPETLLGQADASLYENKKNAGDPMWKVKALHVGDGETLPLFLRQEIDSQDLS